MKAIRIARPGGPEVLERSEMAAPVAGAGEALVRIRAAGINRADLLQRMGRYPAPPGAPRDVPGLEFAGLLEALGPGAEGGEWQAGDRVMGILGGGGYAELAAVPLGQLMPVPPGLSWPEAGAIPEVFLTAADALFERGRLAAGEHALIHSAGGGVGTAALQLARHAGAGAVIGTASAAKLERIRDRELPLDVGIDYRAGPFRDAVLAATGGGGVDVILDTVGAPYWEDNVACLAILGRLVLVGVMGGAAAEVDLRALMGKRATVVGTVLRARPLAEKAALTVAFRTRFLPAFEPAGVAGPPGSAPALVPVVDRTFPLAEAAAAHRYVEENRAFGKVVLEVD